MTEDTLCGKCGHKMSVHVDEGNGLRCHSILTEDLSQCECKVGKGANSIDWVNTLIPQSSGTRSRKLITATS